MTAGDAPTVPRHGTPVVDTTRGAAGTAVADDAAEDHVTTVLQLTLGHGGLGVVRRPHPRRRLPAPAVRGGTAGRLLTDASATASTIGRALWIAAASD